MSKDNDKTLENSPKKGQNAEKPKFQMPKKHLSEYHDLQQLRMIHKNALRLGIADYAASVEVRINEILETEAGLLAPEFEKSLARYEELLFKKHKKRVQATYVRRMFKRYGAIGAITKTVEKKNRITYGLTQMLEAGEDEFTFEQIVIDNPEKFSSDTVKIAKEKVRR